MLFCLVCYVRFYVFVDCDLSKELQKHKDQVIINFVNATYLYDKNICNRLMVKPAFVYNTGVLPTLSPVVTLTQYHSRKNPKTPSSPSNK